MARSQEQNYMYGLGYDACRRGVGAGNGDPQFIEGWIRAFKDLHGYAWDSRHRWEEKADKGPGK